MAVGQMGVLGIASNLSWDTLNQLKDNEIKNQVNPITKKIEANMEKQTELTSLLTMMTSLTWYATRNATSRHWIWCKLCLYVTCRHTSECDCLWHRLYSADRNDEIWCVCKFIFYRLNSNLCVVCLAFYIKKK